MGSVFLLLVIQFPILSLYYFLFALVVGKAHAFGAWIAMWRARRFTWKYTLFLLSITIVATVWGSLIASREQLAFFTYTLFAFHFFFDEYQLQDQKLSKNTLFTGFIPYITVTFYLFNEYFAWGISSHIIIAISLALTCIELFFIKSLDWFFIQSKAMSLFIWAAIAIPLSSHAILGVILTYHYFFWFVYPVYKLHKYKREERDGLIMIILLVISTTTYYAFTKDSYGMDAFYMSVRAFQIGTIIHILSTPPFGYFLGLKKIQYQTT